MSGWRKRQVLDMALEAGFNVEQGFLLRITGIDEDLERFADLVRADEREACHALRQTLPNPHEHCQVSAHAYDMAIAAYGVAIRARGQA